MHQPEPLLAGTGRCDITPAPGTPQGGWGAQTHQRGDRADMPFHATALALRQGGQSAVIVELDAIGFDAPYTARLIQAVAELTRLSPSSIRISCSHTHSGPNTFRLANISEGRDMAESYLDALPQRIAGAAWQALSSLQPVRVAAGDGHCRINRKRRVRVDGRTVVGCDPGAPADHSLRVVRFDSLDGRTVATLLNYACHGTTIAWQSRSFTPDFPGPARAVVEQHLGGRCLFLQGAAADLGPREGFSGDLALYRRLGTELGLAAAHTAIALETLPRRPMLTGVIRSGADIALYDLLPVEPTPPLLRVVARDVELPIRQLPPVAEIEAELARLRANVARLRSQGNAEELSLANALATQCGWRAANARAYGGRATAPWPLQAIAIGPVILLSVAGEPFSSLGQEIAAQSPFPFTLFSGYSNGGFGYIPDLAAYTEGGYEIEATPFAPEAGERLCREALALLKELAQEVLA
ncbi:MAG: hypothetical protein HY821_04080 [Acidobacteria bacterium]|nr:hypothetical protein [Acidobacteriota bacterium]